jgi:hypothetical protein
MPETSLSPSAAEVNSGLTLHSTFSGSGHPVKHADFDGGARRRPSEVRRFRLWHWILSLIDEIFLEGVVIFCADRFKHLPAIDPPAQRARTRGKILIAPAAPPPQTSRDFVPWRFLDAGRQSAWLGRHPDIQKPYS